MPGGPAVIGDRLTISDPSRRSGRIPTGASLEGGRIGPGFLVGCAIVLSAWQPRATRISSRGPDRGWSGGDLQALENPSDDDGITEKGDHRHPSPTPRDDSIVLRYFIENRSTTALHGLYAGFFADLDLGGDAVDEGGGVYGNRLLAYMYDEGVHVGVCLLEGKVGSGIYFVKMTSGADTSTRQITIVK